LGKSRTPQAILQSYCLAIFLIHSFCKEYSSLESDWSSNSFWAT
jgi:hypothetical protein